MINYNELRSSLRTLVTQNETKDPFLSCFVDRTNPLSDALLTERARVVRKALHEDDLPAFEEALGRIEGYLANQVKKNSRGVALFARAGEDPFFLALEFEVSIPTELAAGPLPNVYRLVELKDMYHRYVVLISNEQEARILEVSLGTVTRQLWTERPELRKRVGREWTKRHYHNHRRDRTDQFLKEKIRLLEKIMAAGGHSHLVLAGSAPLTGRLKKLLPRHLSDRLVDLVSTESRAHSGDVVKSTLAAFVEQEQEEAIRTAELLEVELRRGGLATIGFDACEESLENGQADTLVLASEGASPELTAEARERLVRLAELSGANIEIVDDDQIMGRLGGVGCLLRYATPQESPSAPTLTA